MNTPESLINQVCPDTGMRVGIQTRSGRDRCEMTVFCPNKMEAVASAYRALTGQPATTIKLIFLMTILVNRDRYILVAID